MAENPTWGQFGRWAAGFAIYSFVALGSEDTKVGEVMAAMTWVIAIGATVFWWDDLQMGITALLGDVAPIHVDGKLGAKSQSGVGDPYKVAPKLGSAWAG